MGILLAVVCGVASGVAVDVSVVTAAAIAVAAASLAVLPPPSSLSGCRPVPGPSLSLLVSRGTIVVARKPRRTSEPSREISRRAIFEGIGAARETLESASAVLMRVISDSLV